MPYRFIAIRIPAYLLLAVLSLLLLMAATPASATGKDNYSLGTFPFLSSTRIEEAFGPFVIALRTRLRAPVRFSSGSSYAQFVRQLHEERYDIAFVQPLDYVRTAQHHGYLPLLTRGDELRATIVTRAGAPFTRIADLRDRTIALPPEQAAVSYLVKSAVADAGIPAEHIHYLHTRNHSACLQKLQIGQADACGTPIQFVELFEAKNDVQLQRVGETPAINHSLFVVHQRVPAPTRERIRQTLLATTTGNPTFHKVWRPDRPNHLRAVNDTDYQSTRELLIRFGELPAALAGDSEHRQPITLGILPYSSLRHLQDTFAPIAEDLHLLLGHPVRLETARSIETFYQRLLAGSYDVAMVNIFTYLEMRKRDYRPLAINTNEFMKAHIMVPARSEIQLPADLLGKTVGIASTHAATWPLVRYQLLQNGYDANADIRWQTTRTQMDCVMLLRAGRVDACATVGANMNINRSQLPDLRSILETRRVPFVMYIAQPWLDADQRKVLTDYFVARGEMEAVQDDDVAMAADIAARLEGH